MKITLPQTDWPQSVLSRIGTGQLVTETDRYLLFRENDLEPLRHSIYCKACGRHSFNAIDAEQRFCGGCNVWHDYPAPNAGPERKEDR